MKTTNKTKISRNTKGWKKKFKKKKKEGKYTKNPRKKILKFQKYKY
jgi:hypothetical protein